MGRFFPEDLVIEILSFLPVISVIRFKCVCNSWYDLFRNPNFISKHRTNSDNYHNDDLHQLFVGHRDAIDKIDDFMTLSYNTLNVIAQDFKFQDFDDRFWDHPRLLGSYNGLVCLADERVRNIAFCNPATRQCKFVHHSRKATYRIQHGFGYDFKTNDYKIMRITCLTNQPPHKYFSEVYSFNTDYWSNSRAIIPERLCFPNCQHRPSTCVNGIFSTLAYVVHAKEKGLRTYFLFTFDMSSEVFIITPMPEAATFEKYSSHSWQYKSLAELKKSVAFITCPSGSSKNEESFVIWILNEYGSNGTWTKLYTFSSLSGSLYCNFIPIGFGKNDELFIDGGNEGLVMFDPRTRELKKLEIRGVYKQILEYKESLVWINEGYQGFRKNKKLNFPRRTRF